ncbi:acyl carrier protein [soil metagenome]
MNFEERIRRVIAEQFCVELQTVTPDKRMAEDLGSDSLDQLEIVMNIEDEFSIQIDENGIKEALTVQQVIDLVMKAVTAQH